MWCYVLTPCRRHSYATVLLNSYYVLPAFTRHYGVEVEGSPGSYVIPSQIQVAINAGTTGSIILGIFLGAPVIDRYVLMSCVSASVSLTLRCSYGARFTLFCGTLITTGFIFLTFFAHNIWMILAGALLTAMPWGSFSGTSRALSLCVCTARLTELQSSARSMPSSSALSSCARTSSHGVGLAIATW